MENAENSKNLKCEWLMKADRIQKSANLKNI